MTCIEVLAAGNRCAQIAGLLVSAEHNLKRVARIANRDRESYAKYADELAHAKVERDQARAKRDDHLAECPAAADRFGL